MTENFRLNHILGGFRRSVKVEIFVASYEHPIYLPGNQMPKVRRVTVTVFPFYSFSIVPKFFLHKIVNWKCIFVMKYSMRGFVWKWVGQKGLFRPFSVCWLFGQVIMGRLKVLAHLSSHPAQPRRKTSGSVEPSWSRARSNPSSSDADEA